MKTLELTTKELLLISKVLQDFSTQINQNPQMLQKDALIFLANSVLKKIGTVENVSIAGEDILYEKPSTEVQPTP